MRAKVGKDAGPRGTVEPLGWITSVKRDITGDLEQKLIEKDEDATNAAFHRRAASESMASRIAQRRFIRHQESKPGLLLSSRELAGVTPPFGRPPMTPTTNHYDQVVERLRQQAMVKPENQRPKEKSAEVWLVSTLGLKPADQPHAPCGRCSTPRFLLSPLLACHVPLL